jgi:betaine-aldehyde dehydrogenase
MRRSSCLLLVGLVPAVAGSDAVAAAARVLAGPRVAGDLAGALAAQARQIRTWPPSDPDVPCGPLNSTSQLERVAGFAEGLPDHADVLAGGSRPAGSGYHYGLEDYTRVIHNLNA